MSYFSLETVLDSGFHAVDSTFQVSLDSGFPDSKTMMI